MTDPTTNDLLCCYRIPPCVGGRPLRLEDTPRAARLLRGRGWG